MSEGDIQLSDGSSPLAITERLIKHSRQFQYHLKRMSSILRKYECIDNSEGLVSLPNEWTVEHCRDYFERNGDQDIVDLCDAILDKRNALGVTWLMTDFDGIFNRLDDFPDNWVIGQARDWLREIVEELKDV